MDPRLRAGVRWLTRSARGRALAAAIIVVAVAAPLLIAGGEPPRARRDAEATRPAAGGIGSPDPSPNASASAGAFAGGGPRWNGYGVWREYPEGTLGSADSSEPSISANGRWVAFSSDSPDLVRGDTNRVNDVFVKDRGTGKLTRVSVSSKGRQSNDGSWEPAISGDGRFIAFLSHASNLVPGDTNSCPYATRGRCPDVFVHDQLTHKTTRVSVSSSGAQANRESDRGVDISTDGRYVTFASRASNLVGGDTNRTYDVFRRDRRTGRTVRVSVGAGGVQGNDASAEPSISSDGARIAFLSDATNLGPRTTACSQKNGGDFGCQQALLRDLSSATTKLVARSSKGVLEVSISGDGRFVGFSSHGDDLVAGDTNNATDVFVHELANARTTRVSVSSSEEQGNNGSMRMAFSEDGRYVAFSSEASNLVDNDKQECTVLEDGSKYSCLDVFLRDRVAGTTTLVSVTTSGVQADFSSFTPSLSADGRHVAFDSQANNLPRTPSKGSCSAEAPCLNVYVRDRVKGTTRAVSTKPPRTRTTAGDGHSFEPSVSSDGSAVAFGTSDANIVRGDTNGKRDVIIWRRDGRLSRVSVSSSGREANGDSVAPAISSDAKFIAFVSEATDLVLNDSNGHTDIFVRDMEHHRTIRVSVSSAGDQANGDSSDPQLSSNGRYIVFRSEASNLVSGDTNGAADVFVHDRSTGQTTRVSVSSQEVEANGESYSPSISANGRLVSFSSIAWNLDPRDTPGCPNITPEPKSCLDVFVRDRVAGMTLMISTTDEGTTANADSFGPSISGDGRFVVFLSNSTDLAGGRQYTNETAAYMRDLEREKTTRIPDLRADYWAGVDISNDGRFLGSAGTIRDLARGTSVEARCSEPYNADLAGAGRYLVFSSLGCDGVDEPHEADLDVYIFDRQTRTTRWISRPTL